MRLASGPAAVWLALAALAAFAWREGIAFALSSGAAADVEAMFFDAADNPPWLITLVAVLLLVARRRELRAKLGPPGSPWLAAALLAPGLALLGWGRFVSAPDLSLVGALLMALGAALGCFGARLAGFVAVPLGLLVFAVPAPGALVNALVYPLQLWTSDYAFALANAVGVTALQATDVIRTASHTFLVVEGCSGLGSMEVLTFLAIAWAWYAGASFARGLVLALAAPLIAFALNGPRVLGLILAPENPFWSGHTTQGVVVFVIGALAIALLDSLLEPREPAPPPHAASAPWPARPAPAVALALGAAALVSVLVPRYALPAALVPPELLPATAGPWRSTGTVDLDRLYLGSVQFTQSAHRRYVARPAPLGTAGAGEPARADVFVGMDLRRTRGASPRSRKHRVAGRGWILESVRPEVFPGGMAGERVLARRDGERVLSWVWSVSIEGLWTETLRELLALDQSPWHRTDRAFVVRVSTELDDRPETAQAERRLRHLIRSLGRALPGPRRQG